MLATLNVQLARGLLQKLVHMWDALEARGGNPNEFVKRGKAKLLDASKNLTTDDGEALIDFSHPYVWAPFAVLGYSNFCMEVLLPDTRDRSYQIGATSACNDPVQPVHTHINLVQFGVEDLIAANVEVNIIRIATVVVDAPIDSAAFGM